jgi:phage baseplate assembly protein W
MISKEETHIYSDIDDKWKFGEKGIHIVYDQEALKTAVRNILGTMKKERVMRPTFGVNREVVMEPMDEDTAIFIGMELRSANTGWDSRLEVVGVNCIPDYKNNLYDVEVSLKETNTGELVVSRFTLEGETK